MKLIHLIVVATAFLSQPALSEPSNIVESRDEAISLQFSSPGDSKHHSLMIASNSPKNNAIQTFSASGERQTTIIDESGNLRIQNSDQDTNPTQPEMNRNLPNQAPEQLIPQQPGGVTPNQAQPPASPGGVVPQPGGMAPPQPVQPPLKDVLPTQPIMPQASDQGSLAPFNPPATTQPPRPPVSDRPPMQMPPSSPPTPEISSPNWSSEQPPQTQLGPSRPQPQQDINQPRSIPNPPPEATFDATEGNQMTQPKP